MLGVNFDIEFLTGEAGTGKTTELRNRMDRFDREKPNPKRNYRKYAVLTATTGIAAVNMAHTSEDNVRTINSTLKFSDLESLEDKVGNGEIQKQLKRISRQANILAIDEISMFPGEAFDYLVHAMVDVNEARDVQQRGGLHLLVSGDFCQLPPVQGKFCFQGTYWPSVKRFTKLTKIWRQESLEFYTAISKARQGDGEACAEMLRKMDGVEFLDRLDTRFDGTTIFPLNQEVKRLNHLRLFQLIQQGSTHFVIPTKRWGRQRSEWVRIIDNELELCDDAYVMILANDSPDFTYANGDCGYIVDYDQTNQTVDVQLVRNNEVVTVKKITRLLLSKQAPMNMAIPETPMDRSEYIEMVLQEDPDKDESIASMEYYTYLNKLTQKHRQKSTAFIPYYDFVQGRWVLGGITYMPLRLAYASTVHKAQGLSLDRVQINYGNKFFSRSCMSYVALSRCKNPAGLRIVGSPELLASRTNILRAILPWV